MAASSAASAAATPVRRARYARSVSAGRASVSCGSAPTVSVAGARSTVPPSGSLEAAEDPHERRLADPVGTDDPEARAVVDLEVDAVEDHLGPVVLGDGVAGQHPGTPYA